MIGAEVGMDVVAVVIIGVGIEVLAVVIISVGSIVTSTTVTGGAVIATGRSVITLVGNSVDGIGLVVGTPLGGSLSSWSNRTSCYC